MHSQGNFLFKSLLYKCNFCHCFKIIGIFISSESKPSNASPLKSLTTEIMTEDPQCDDSSEQIADNEVFGFVKYVSLQMSLTVKNLLGHPELERFFCFFLFLTLTR